VPWFQRLSLRILKPSQRISFETALTLSLEDTRASRSQQQESDLAPKTQDISGPTSLITSDQYDLFGASLKTSKDTSALGSEKLLATWKAQVIKQRGEYSARLKSVRPTSESESSLWRTPSAQESGIKVERLQTKSGGLPVPGERLYDKETGRNSQYGLSQQVRMWPTPTAQDNNQVAGQYQNLKSGTTLGGAVRNWPTPAARDYKDTPGMATIAKNPDGTERKRLDQLARAVYQAESATSGHLNPDWVEWLMGVPTGWTGLGSWETE